MKSHRAFLGLVTGSRLQAATDHQGYLATLPISKRTRPTAQFSADWWATMTQVRKRVRGVKLVFSPGDEWVELGLSDLSTKHQLAYRFI